ncbi:MAG: family 78 glycoside hydrolase catalytic domain [Bacteroidales bacterium]|nr:family 78 glycoside hydrolase catalytic domain [Bacteroidales bacterium]
MPASAESGKDEVQIVNLRTEAMDTPLGLDEARPYFSWQMRSGRTGALQRAYRVLVALSEEDLQAGSLVYDSGMIRSDASLNIPYEGAALRPSTRYFWKVQVRDEQDALVESDPTWFETGLMGSGWSRAEWIGSQEVGVSRYRTFFDIDYDVQIPQGSSRAVFAYSVQDEKNWITAEYNIQGTPKFIIEYCVEGDIRHLSTIDLGGVVTDPRAQHHVCLQVSTPGYHLKSNLIVHFDGRTLRPTEGVPGGPRRENVNSGNPFQMVITPYPGGEYICDWARLHSIGFRQPRGEKATFSNIVISERNWDTVLYTDPTVRHDVTGTGRLQVWEPYGLVSAPMLRRDVQVSKPLKSARLYVTARGIYEFYVNGRRVSNDYYNPGWTDYRYRIMYNAYDITGLLKPGSNGLGAMLGAGWYSDLNIFTSAYVDPYGIRQSLLAKVLLTYEDGSSEVIVTDGSWKKWDHGPVTRNGFQFGEDYDARKEVDGWTEGGFDDSAWSAADILERPAPGVQIQAYVGLPVQNNITLAAVSVNEPVKGTFVYDFGQNIIGVPRLEGMRGKAGQVVNLRYGEMIYPERIPTDPVAPYTVGMYQAKKGQVYVENYRGAISIDNYTMRGSREGETYQPVFTDHGFRYVSVTGLDKPLPLSAVKAVVLESIGHTTADYESSEADINRLFQNIQWGQRDNFQAVPTDCPQRDERQGWTGDAQVFARTATYFSPWVDKFYARWLWSMRDNQNYDGSYFNYYPVTGRPPYGFTNDQPGWMGWMEAGIIVPYQVWEQYGDIRVLQEHWDSMVRYMDYLERQANPDGTQVASGIGDHLAIERTDIGLTNTAYYAYDAYMMSRMASALGRSRESRRYAALYEKVKAGFVAKYMREDGVTVAPYVALRWPGMPVDPNAPKDGEIVPVDTQTSYALPLRFGLLDGELRDRAVAHLVADIEQHGSTLTTGFIGTPYLNLALSENGRSDVAYTLFEQTKYPSWLYPVLQGATTMWERWNSYTLENGFGPVDMNSFNHYAYGAIGEWMYSHQLGIQRDENRPAYKHILLQPKVGGKETFARGGFESPYGRIEAGWEKTDGGYFYRVTIPANTTASLTLETERTGSGQTSRHSGLDPEAPSPISKVFVRKGMEGVGEPRALRGRVMMELDSGSFVFEVKY